MSATDHSPCPRVVIIVANKNEIDIRPLGSSADNENTLYPTSRSSCATPLDGKATSDQISAFHSGKTTWRLEMAAFRVE